MLKTPKFWIKKNLISCALLPLSVVKIFTKTAKISKPVICVGNLIAGGSGKTPTAIAIGKILNEMSANFAFLSRGYMSDGSKFLMLNKEDKNNADQVGDEPILLIETAPTFVSTNRLFGARQIDKMNRFRMLVLDDGMQNDSLHRDLTILVVDGKIGFGNNFLIPAGPMREPLCWGLKKADFVVLIGEAKAGLLKKLSGKTVIKAKVIPTNLKEFYGKNLMAFCGLAYPQKFFSLLSDQGLKVLETRSFPDHYNYKLEELTELCKNASEKGATLITTKKDWVKFPPIIREQIAYLDIELEFENREFVEKSLKKFL